MSTLLEQASLVMIPSGYKEDIVYSQIPTDGSGDLSFTRASNGTRVNSAGLVEVCPWNLADNSENLTLWGSYAVSGTITRTANYATAPNGTMTATRIQNSGGSVVQWTYQDINLINSGTISMYVKRTGSTNQTFDYLATMVQRFLQILRLHLNGKDLSLLYCQVVQPNHTGLQQIQVQTPRIF